jgi:formimidoylglutamate deiminase
MGETPKPAVTMGETPKPPARPARTPAEELWRIGSTESAAACGFDDAGGTVTVDLAAPELALVHEAHLLDAVVYSGQNGVLV